MVHMSFVRRRIRTRRSVFVIYVRISTIIRVRKYLNKTTKLGNLRTALGTVVSTLITPGAVFSFFHFRKRSHFWSNFLRTFFVLFSVRHVFSPSYYISGGGGCKYTNK